MRKGAAMGPTVRDVCAALEQLAPLALAAEWDNVGLLAGRPEWPATSILLAIDLTDAVAREALRRRANVLVVYHPPIFKGIRAVTPAAEGPSALLPDLLAARVSIIALHTALDAAAGGTNDVLLDAFEPTARYPLEPAIRTQHQYKLVAFVPRADADRLRSALAAAGAGVIGHYSECSFELDGRGTFRGDETTQPAIGQRQVHEHVDETRLEMVLPAPALGRVVRALYANHSYEEPAFDLYPLHDVRGRGEVGMGRVGLLNKPERGTALLRRLAARVDLTSATIVGDVRRRFRSVTAAAGAFGVRAFRDAESLVLAGEFKHHDALDLLRRGVTAVHLGHWASERPVLPVVCRHLEQHVARVRVALARADATPFSKGDILLFQNQ